MIDTGTIVKTFLFFQYKPRRMIPYQPGEDKDMKLTTIFTGIFLLIYFPTLSFAFETLTTVYFESSAP